MRRVAGLDLAAGRGVTALAVLRVGDDNAIEYESEERRQLSTDDEIVQTLGRLRPRVLAVDAPLSLPDAVTAALGLRAEDTSRHGSPYTRAAERDPIWSSVGVRPFPVSFLGGLTFRALVLSARLRTVYPEITLIETFPTATFRLLGLAAEALDGKRPRKATAAARDALQRRLAAHVGGIPSPEGRLLDADDLDAIGAALAALAFDRGAYRAVGDPMEGQIILPVSSLPATTNDAVSKFPLATR